jgi:hypothetical protein
LEDPDVDRRIILKWIGGRAIDWINLAQDRDR